MLAGQAVSPAIPGDPGEKGECLPVLSEEKLREYCRRGLSGIIFHTTNIGHEL
jgi:hypothetical protein